MSDFITIPPTAPARESETPPSKPELTKDQFNKLSALLAHLNDEQFTLPVTVKDVKAAQKLRHKKLGPTKISEWSGLPLTSGSKDEQLRGLDEVEKCFLSSEQCQRFLRAVKWDLPAAFCRTEETIVWRREFEVEKINENPEMVEEEAKTGKEVIMGWDLQKRPCLYMFPYRQNTNTLERQIQFVVWCLERTVDMMGPGVENLCLLIDFGTGEKGGGGQPTSLGQARKVLSILQTYYCERLGRALCVRIPTIFYTFYRLVSPFVDPVTKDKIRFNPDCRTLVPPSQLDQQAFGGDFNFKYEHDDYFPFLHQEAKKRREQNMERWRQYGGNKCGLSEVIIKGRVEENEEEQGQQQQSQETNEVPQSETAPVSQVPVATAVAAAVPLTNNNTSTNGETDRNTLSDSTPTLTPAVSQSVGTSERSSPVQPVTPSTKASDDEHRSFERNQASLQMNDTVVMNGNRPRGNSADSFVTTQDSISPAIETAIRDDDRLDAMLDNKEGKTLTSGGSALDTGIAGLVIKEDGSIGAA